MQQISENDGKVQQGTIDGREKTQQSKRVCLAELEEWGNKQQDNENGGKVQQIILQQIGAEIISIDGREKIDAEKTITGLCLAETELRGEGKVQSSENGGKVQLQYNTEKTIIGHLVESENDRGNVQQLVSLEEQGGKV